MVDPLSSVLDGTDPLSMFAATSDPAAAVTVTVRQPGQCQAWWVLGWRAELSPIMHWGILIVSIQDTHTQRNLMKNAERLREICEVSLYFYFYLLIHFLKIGFHVVHTDLCENDCGLLIPLPPPPEG